MNYLISRVHTSDYPQAIKDFKILSLFGKNRVGFSSPQSAQIEVNKKYSPLKSDIIFQDFYYFDGSVTGKIEKRTAIIISEKSYNNFKKLGGLK